MNIAIKNFLAAGLLASAVCLSAAPASALPILGRAASQSEPSATVDKVWYRCGYYRCYRRHYVYYPRYRYGGYYRPHVGIRIGGIGFGFY